MDIKGCISNNVDILMAIICFVKWKVHIKLSGARGEMAKTTYSTQKMAPENWFF